MLTRRIAKTGEELPVIGLGTRQTFDVGASDRERRDNVPAHFWRRKSGRAAARTGSST